MAGTFKKFGEKISNAAKSTAKKSEELIETGKVRSKIRENEAEIEKLKKDIGEATYVKYNEGGVIFDEAKVLCESIKAAEENIAVLEEQILRLRRVRVCSSCGKEVEDTVSFCPVCGHKFEPLPEPEKEEPEEEGEEEEGGNKCPSCGTQIEEGVAFCPNCGAKVE
jgi:predicted RNA-binding Zn-ribbon protein involved in translation (DUF1610 family)